MDRREFFTLRRRSVDTSPRPFAGLRQINTGIAQYAGPWTTNEVVHLLKRTMFGAKKADIDFFKGMSMSQAVDALLTAPASPAAPLKNYSGADAVAAGATWVNNVSEDEDVNAGRVSSYKSWWTGVMLNQNRSILEKLLLFWHNHFSTETAVYLRGTYAYKHNELLRQNALGNFKQLVRKVTLDHAMLFYLNGYLNVKEAPDENYARELMELFTLGKENNPNYTEDDVKAAAKVLTGWKIKFTDDTVYFDPAQHDTGNKTFSSFFSGTTITGLSGATAGDGELDALLNMIFNKQTEVSEFIIRKIYRFFCYYTIDADTETNVIKPLAQLFRTNNWDIKLVLTTLFKSEHFFDPLNQGCLIKSPIDLMVGLCREFNIVFPAGYADQYNMWDFIRSEAGEIQQNVGDPPSVSGWPAYYQVPGFHELWINHATLPRRNVFSDVLIQNGYTRSGQKIQIDPVAFAKTLPNPGDPNALINDSLDVLYRVPVSQASKDVIKKQILLSNQDLDYYWSNAWNAHIASPGDTTAYNVVYTRLQTLYKYFMNLAEYQLA